MPKLSRLVVKETSGVDHPAHLHPGWLVKKSVGHETAQALVRALAGKEETMPKFDMPVLKGLLDSLPTEREAMVKAIGDATPAVTAEFEAIRKDVSGDDFTPLLDQLAQVWQGLQALANAANPDVPSPQDGVAPVAPAAPAVMPDAQQVLASISKSTTPEVAEFLKAQFERTATLEKAAREREERDAITLAKSKFGAVLETDDAITAFAKGMAALAAVDATAHAAIESAMTKAASLNDSAEAIIVKELGAGAPAVAGSADEKVRTLQKALQAADPKLTPEMAYAKALADNPDLYNQLREEQKR